MTNSARGVVFDIQHYSLHDGPGIRSTVFFKGCPLACKWCSNPESQSHAPQIMYYRNICTACGACIAACPHGALRLNGAAVARATDRCRQCGECASVCKSKARSFSGRTMSVAEICTEVREHWRIFMQSGGGITCSGGEALTQPVFLENLLAEIHDELGFHTCLDTTGCASWETLAAMLPHLDLILLDIKHMDTVMHREGTGAGNDTILRNAARLGKLKFPVTIRLPLIPQFNDSRENLAEMGSFLQENNLNSVEIMPYHEFGKSKYAALQIAYQAPPLKPPAIALAVGTLKDFGLDVTVHGE